MIEQQTPLRGAEWTLAATIALLGSIILFDAYPGVNWAIWVAAAVCGTLFARRTSSRTLAEPPLVLGIAAILAAGAATRTTSDDVHFGIVVLTAVLLAAFLISNSPGSAGELGPLTFIKSPFAALARVATSALRETGLAIRGASESPRKTVLRRVLLITPVILVIVFLLGGADPLIHSAIQSVQDWLPNITLSARVVFFAFLFAVILGASSRLPDLTFGFAAPNVNIRNSFSATDGLVLAGCTLATLVAFLGLQMVYLFVRLPNQIGNGITYAEYARRGFGELCVVVTIVAGVILLAEATRGADGTARAARLNKIEFALIVAAGLILLSAQRRIMLYEQAYGYTVARVQATLYVVFMAGFLILLARELWRGRISPALGRSSSLFAVALLLTILYWNDRAWIMNRNIDRVRVTGKFDTDYATSLSRDAFPTLVRRRNELPPGAWVSLSGWAACQRFNRSFEWYEWNSARVASQSASEELNLPAPAKCSRRKD